MKKKYRIKKNQEIASIVNAKNKVIGNNFIIYYQISSIENIRVAFSVSKKYGKAFERNKAKRIARSLFQDYTKEYLKLNLVVVIKPALKKTVYLELKKEVDFLMKLISKKTKEKSA